MNKLLREILTLFIVVVLSNILVEFIDKKEFHLENPVKFFCIALIVSIIGGFIKHRLSEGAKKQSEQNKEQG